jgi:hypothetical protein
MCWHTSRSVKTGRSTTRNRTIAESTSLNSRARARTRCSDKYWSVKPLLSSREDRLRRARRIDITRPKNGVPHQVSGHSQRSAAGLQVFDQDLDFERIRAEEDTNYLWTLLLDLAYHS